MGVAAYNRGSAVIRRQIDAQIQTIQERQDRRDIEQLIRDWERLDAGVKEYAERFHYFYAAEWWHDARLARLKGLRYRRKRDRIAKRLRQLGFSEVS